VVVASGLDALTILRWCEDHLSGPEWQVAIELRENLPRSPAGKILQKYM
jgi:hypothetical protein